MIKSLISLNADLASSIALRYACRLANRLKMDLRSIHVEEEEPETSSPGTGWVRKTWEDGLLKTAQQRISQLINAERAGCPGLVPPRMCLGDREGEILHELNLERYDLLVEGQLYSFNPANFFDRINSRIHRKAPCPILVVKNLVEVRKVAILITEDMTLEPLMHAAGPILKGLDIKPALLSARFSRGAHKDAGGDPSPEKAMAAAAQRLAGMGWEISETRVVRGTPIEIAEGLGEFGLVVSSPEVHEGKRGRFAELLGRVPSAVLLCRQK